MNDLRTAAQQVLEAWNGPQGMPAFCKAMDALRAALAQEQAEPETCVYREDDLAAVKSRRKD